LLQPLNVPIRPKIIRNDATGKYVLMAALISPDFNAFNDVIVATADAPAGPYELRGKLGWEGKPNQTSAEVWKNSWGYSTADQPERIRGFDLGLFKDAGGKAYLMVGHEEVFIYELSSDYLSAVRVQKMEGAHGEAPALIKAGDTYYLICSLLTGWAPNENVYFTSPSIRGPWEPKGPFARGPKQETTFDSQVCYLLPVAGKSNAFIFIADNFHVASDREIPDMREATHVWLPVELDSDARTLVVNWQDEWDPSVPTNG